MGRRRPVFRLTPTPTPLRNTSQSPTSPSSPLSPPPIPAPPRSSSSTSPSSTTSGPLTPPPRLHLRAIIPSPLLPAEYFKTAPPFPYPWIWRCHLCHSVYRLGVTRRCLEDGHFFCSLPSPPTPSPSPSPPSPVLPAAVATKSDDIMSMPTLSGTRDPALELKAASRKSRAQRRKTKRRAASRGCHAEFDYGGWAGYNTWRGEVRLLKRERMRRAVTRSRTRVMRGMDGVDVRGKGSVWASGDLDLERGSGPGPGPGRSGFGSAWGRGGQGWNSGGGRDCWRDCNFPSECHHERREERLWEAKMREERRWEESGEDLLGSESDSDSDSDSDSESESESLSLRERERRRSEDNSVPIDLLTESAASMEDFEMGGTGDYDEYSNRDGDGARDAPSAEIRVGMQLEREREPDIDFTCLRDAGAEEEEDEGRNMVVALGPLGTDCDGLGEADIQECYTQSVRRKSLGGLGPEGSPSSSPLKEVAFGFEDVVWGGMGC
ncbi:hypothetical protein LZ554_002940 [Drepanopeziza brunnea f. sp. 'monogermtubi']|nr:hypothetical protein LZ554_002940 [Drepanopeziza brunnea f. sp. 'monogermtubi']